MNLSTIVVTMLLVGTCQCTLLGPLLSLTILPYTIIYNLAGIAGVKVALALKLLGLLGWWRAGISDATLDRELDFRGVELPTGAVFPGTPNLPVHMIPGILAEIVRSVLQDDNVGSGFFQREPAVEQQPASPWERSRGTPASPLGLLLGGGQWPADPQSAQPGVQPFFVHPDWTAAMGYDRYKRGASTSSETQPPPGFYRRPRLGKLGKAPTARELYGYTLEMIQDIDADDCMLKLCCEVGADPVRYGSYGRRLSSFIRQLHQLSGEPSLLRRYHEAYQKGHSSFRGNGSMCAPTFSNCTFDMQRMTDLVF